MSNSTEATPRQRGDLPSTLGELEASGYRPRSVKQELRENLKQALARGDSWLEGIVGYDETVRPQLENALLSQHDFILLGLRGQAKTRIVRQLVKLLDPFVPFIEGCPLRSDPLLPMSAFAKRLVAERGSATPIGWLAREARYHEKLATPDASIADMIGDVDPIKAARERLDLGSEDAIHFGIIPRSNRGIFALNELPDLQPRIQVGLLNIMEENDVQIRGFPIRIPLDLLLAFTANPEDYTNRGNIITPLKDRIDSQIITHYPRSIDDAIAITLQEAWTERGDAIAVPRYVEEILEEIAFIARASDSVDQSSGVSQRLPIRARELLLSSVERRALLHPGEPRTPRLSDLAAVIPAVTGRIELVYEGEQEGPVLVAHKLIGRALLKVFGRYFPPVYTKEPKGRREDEGRRRSERRRGEEAEGSEARGSGRRGGDGGHEGTPSVYAEVLSYFSAGGQVELHDDMTAEGYRKALEQVPGLGGIVEQQLGKQPLGLRALGMEWVLESLHQASLLSRQSLDGGIRFSDVLADMFSRDGA